MIYYTLECTRGPGNPGGSPLGFPDGWLLQAFSMACFFWTSVREKPETDEHIAVKKLTYSLESDRINNDPTMKMASFQWNWLEISSPAVTKVNVMAVCGPHWSWYVGPERGEVTHEYFNSSLLSSETLEKNTA